MDRLDLARQRLSRLSPTPPFGINEASSDGLEDWLRHDVVPVVQDLLDNPAFRRVVLTFVVQLFADKENKRRRQLNEFAEVLADCARTMVAAAKKFGVVDVLSDRDRADDESWLAEEFNRKVDRRSVVEKMAQRPWFDLVDAEDIWTPQWGLFLRDPDALLTRQFRRELTYANYLGDHVTTLMLARARFWLQRLTTSWTDLHLRLGNLGQPAVDDLSSAFARVVVVEERYRALVAVWRNGGESRLREACLTLLQTYVAYHEAPQLPWLDQSPNSLLVSGAMLRSLFRRRGTVTEAEPVRGNRYRVVGSYQARIVDLEMIRQVAGALEDIAATYRRGVFVDDLIEEARTQYKLLVVVKPRMVFWQGKRLDLDWDGSDASWNLMLHLAVKASGQDAKGPYALSGIKTNRDLSVRKSHLTKFLQRAPSGDALAVLIEKHRKGECYLDVARGEVRVLDMDADEWTVDVQQFSTADGNP